MNYFRIIKCREYSSSYHSKLTGSVAVKIEEIYFIFPRQMTGLFFYSCKELIQMGHHGKVQKGLKIMVEELPYLSNSIPFYEDEFKHEIETVEEISEEEFTIELIKRRLK